MSPILERQPEPLDLKSLSDELPQNQQGHGDTPSPRTPSTNSSASPPPPLPAPVPVEPTVLMPILAEDGIPYDHTLPQYLRHVGGEPALEEIYNMTLRVLTETSSLQQMSIYTPNLRELNLEGSALTSLRDIGSELRFLQILRIGRCRLDHLDGTLGLTSLRELYATGNYITSAAPCAHLSKLRVLDLSRNRIQDTKTLGFLTCCRQLAHILLEGNTVSENQNLDTFLKTTIPTLQSIDGVSLTSEASTLESGAVRPVSSAGPSTSDEPSTSGGTSVSKLTSGQILCGNIAAQRRRGSSPLRESENNTNNVIEASMRWRTAYYKFRETNVQQWEQEKLKTNTKSSDDDDDDDTE